MVFPNGRTVSTRVCVMAFVPMLAACNDEIKATEPPRPVRTVLAQPLAIGEEIAQTGEIQPHTETDLGFRMDGRVASRAVDVGDRVTSDQLVATLNPQDVNNDLQAAEADLRGAESGEAQAKSALDRQRTLFDKGIAPLAKIEEVEANWRGANAKLQATRASLANARNKVGYTELHAPSDGIVSAVGVNAGQVVNAGQMVVRLASTTERDAVFNVSNRLINAVPDDVQVEVALHSDPGVKVVGRPRDVTPTADTATRSYRVRVALPDAPPSMAFGATVTGRIVLPGKPLIPLPASAMTSQDGKPAVFVLDPTKLELALKPVVVARFTESQVLVSSGLQPGEAVVTAGVSKLRPGQKVAAEAGREGSTP